MFEKQSIRQALILSLLVTSLTLAACSKKDPASQNGHDIVSSVEVTDAGQMRPTALSQIPSDQKTGAANDPAMVATVKVTATFDLDAILNQDFLYGADLQYSSKFDPDMELYNQSVALGHIPARFRIVGAELQLVADNKRLYPSEVNHPEMLLTRFKIVARTDKTITVSGMQSDAFLGEIFKGTYSDTHGGFTASEGNPPRDLWIRSFDYVKKGNYILQQTSILSDEGDVGEFMESVFPRANLAPGKDFAKFKMDADDPVGATDGIAARYRLLKGERVFEGENAVSYAAHFDISPNSDGSPGTIDWYVTPNITDEEIKPVALAVEGWNRYYKKEKGIERNVMVFKGRLPEGIHLGDPRFNVINWDNRLVAGAAYESQAADPYTGKQSHSLIYMPAAWLKIGTDYWTTGKFSDHEPVSVSEKSRDGKKGMFKSANTACIKHIASAAEVLASSSLNEEEVKSFGAQLLKQTLFHEVGHALGLAHNFKGSLSFDRADSKTLFSSSIMDYNDFEIERAAFDGVDSNQGPLLEYDRQAISALYNQMKDVKATDAVVPTCNDAEADNEDGGVDPMCIRYDIEKDPTLAITTATDRLEKEKMDGDVTLAQALANAANSMDLKKVQAAKTSRDFKTLISDANARLLGAINFYLIGSKASYSRMIKTNVKALLKFEDSILPDTVSEKEMRLRALNGVRQASDLKELPAVSQKALDAAIAKVTETLKQSPYFQSQSPKSQAEVLTTISNTFTGIEKPVIASVRAKVLAGLARHAAVPFFFGGLDQSTLDVESDLAQILEHRLIDSQENADARKAAVAALVTFKGRLKGDAAIIQARKIILAQREAALDNEDRELAEALLAALP